MTQQPKAVIATVTDHGDPTVGMFPQSWQVECPFMEDEDEETKEFFREVIIKAYKYFAEGRISVDFDYEIKNDTL